MDWSPKRLDNKVQFKTNCTLQSLKMPSNHWKGDTMKNDCKGGGKTVRLVNSSLDYELMNTYKQLPNKHPQG